MGKPRYVELMKRWTREEVYFDGDLFFDRFCAAIASARKSVDLETFIYRQDSLGDRVTELLLEALARGVKVRVVVDGFGSFGWRKAYGRRLKARGAKCKVYHPLPWSRWNRRTHRKILLVDERIAFIGGMNITAVHLPSVDGEDAWRDTAVRVEGTPVSEVVAAFEHHFRRFWRLRRRAPGPHWVTLNHSWRARRLANRDLVRRIAAARTRVWLTNAYFIPLRAILRSLRFAAFMGADVRLLIPGKSNHFFLGWATSAFYPVLLSAGVRIFEYRGSFLHAKSALIDEHATVGSTNLNHRSFVHDLEVDVHLSMPKTRAALTRQFELDLTRSREITLLSLSRQSFPVRWTSQLLARLALTVRYWI